MSFSYNGHLLASGSEDNTVMIWDVSIGESLSTLSGHTADVNSVSFSPNKQLLAGGSESKDGTIRLWNVNSRKYLFPSRGHAYGVNSVAFGPKSDFIVSGSSDGTVLLWDLDDLIKH